MLAALAWPIVAVVVAVIAAATVVHLRRLDIDAKHQADAGAEADSVEVLRLATNARVEAAEKRLATLETDVGRIAAELDAGRG